MGTVRRTVTEAAVVVVLTFVVAAGGNALRAKDQIGWTRAYFEKGQERRPKERTGDIDDPPQTPRLQHSYQEVSFDEMVTLFNDPTTEMGVNIFIDARNDEAYQAGHIPGALQCDHYRLDEYIEGILDPVYEAQKVIVYCNGGSCEDSIFVCKDLRDFDVPYESIYLYAGGWKEWSAKKMRIAKGPNPDGDS